MRESIAFEGGALLLESKNSVGEMGHRIAKHVYASDNEYMLEKSTYYILDAQGNVMSTYDRVINSEEESVSFAQIEKHIFGSSRLGMNTEHLPMLGSQNTSYSMEYVNHRIGERLYELANHLGNVLSVISDKVIPHVATGTTVDYYLADIRQSTDYSPFGVTLHGRNFTASGAEKFRYGFQGQEMDDEIKDAGNSVNYKFRMHDPRVGRFFSIDPMSGQFPHNSPYAFSENRVIDGIELEGAEYYYSANGTLLGKLGESTEVRVINAERIEKFGGEANYMKALGKVEPGSETHLKWVNSDKVSKSAGMNNDELMTRAFMSATSNAENHGNGELPYNASNGFTKGSLNLFTHDDYEKNPDAYKSHPESDGGPAGKYQIRRSTFNGYTKQSSLDGSFSPENQDAIFIGIAEYSRALGDIKSGNIETAVKKMAGTTGGRIEQFASFPGASAPGVTMEEFKKNFQTALKNELNGNSQIATPKGKLLE